MRPTALNGLQQLYYYESCLQEVRDFDQLVRLANAKNAELERLFAQYNIKKGRGISYASRVLDLIATILRTDLDQFRNTHYQCELVHTLSQNLIPGAFPLLPTNILSKLVSLPYTVAVAGPRFRLNGWSKQRFEVVAAHVQDRLPGLRALCEKLDASLYQPIVRGEVLDNIRVANVIDVSDEASAALTAGDDHDA